MQDYVSLTHTMWYYVEVFMSDRAKFIFRVVAAVVTALVTLFMLGLIIFAATIPHWGLFVSCLLLAIAFGFMSVNDVKYFFSKTTEVK